MLNPACVSSFLRRLDSGAQNGKTLQLSNIISNFAELSFQK